MRLFLSYIFLFCCLNGFGQIMSPMECWEYIDWDLSKIKGEINTIEVNEYTALDYFGELKKQSTKVDAVFSFNAKNHLYKAEGILDQRLDGNIPLTTTEEGIKENRSVSISYIIDSSLTDIRMNYLFRGQRYNGRFIWRYDNNRNNIEFIAYVNDSIFLKELAKYNEKNQLIEFKRYFDDGKLGHKTSYSYDKNGNEIEYAYQSNYSLSKTKKIYNTSNQLIEEQNFDEDDKLKRSYTYKYNINGKLIEENESNEGKFVKKEATTYNTKGDKTSITNYDSKGVILNNETFIYNSEDALIEQVYTNKTSKTVASYEYDQKGNWTKKTEYTVSPPNGLPSEYSIIERKITYK